MRLSSRSPSFSCAALVQFLLLSFALSLFVVTAHAVKADSIEDDYTLCGLFVIGKVGNEYRLLEMSTDVMTTLPKSDPLTKVVAKKIKSDEQVFVLLDYLKVGGSLKVMSHEIIDPRRFLMLEGVISYQRFGKQMLLDGQVLKLSDKARENLDKECYTSAHVRKRGHVVVSKANPAMAVMAKFME